MMEIIELGFEGDLALLCDECAEPAWWGLYPDTDWRDLGAGPGVARYACEDHRQTLRRLLPPLQQLADLINNKEKP